jgi:carbamoyl-phosphate synthase large subunit
MPKRKDLRKIAIIGSGPIVIGQACEFDYAGTQACKALREEGLEVVLINSNPATIMTDPEMAHRTYVEPLVLETAERVLRRERPDALLPTLGGQTGLNLGMALWRAGVLQELGIEMIGARPEAIELAENRLRFKEAMTQAGLDVPKSAYVATVQEGMQAAADMDFPLVLRPSYTLGGTGSAIVYNRAELPEALERALQVSPVHEVLMEEYLEGWQEFEMEVMRDGADQAIVVCSIENFDPMGIHTGDSITVAPAQTLSDVDYQKMRDWALRVIRTVGVETGGSNVQFALHPETGRMAVIEMNPRVSRSSALASKATGFPIAKIAAKLAIGYTLDELRNDITGKTVACFEPALDYVVVKIPRWAFEKFPQARATLGTSMKSVGEVMAIGRTFKEALMKALQSLEIDYDVLRQLYQQPFDRSMVIAKLRYPSWDRIFYIFYALHAGMKPEDVAALTGIHPWFLHQIEEIVELEGRLRRFRLETVPPELLRRAKQWGFSHAQVADSLGTTEDALRARLEALGIVPTYKRIDTCAGEFEAITPYLYSTYGSECEAFPTDRPKVVILGSGPNRIGQGIEFDYCCVRAIFALRSMGYETIMVNCNPETVSTDYDTADRLYFEPLTLEHVLNVVRTERPLGVIVQLGGQTPLRLARRLAEAGVPILGTQPEDIHRAEDRKCFAELMRDLGLRHPPFGTAQTLEEALAVAEAIGYPVLVRPSYVLGGRAMAKVFHARQMKALFQEALRVAPQYPVLIDRFIEDAFEYDLDALSDGNEVYIAGILQHIEEAGIHSGDSAMVMPAWKLPDDVRATMIDWTARIARALRVQGLLNIQFAYRDGELYVLEVNPRASRTVPFISKATGVPVVDAAVRLMMGATLRDLGLTGEGRPPYYCVKVPVFPFDRFPEEDPLLGPEMKSTGEVMGIGETFGTAFAKAMLGAGIRLPTTGNVLITVNDRDKAAVVPLARQLHELGFTLLATAGTAQVLQAADLPVTVVRKIHEGRPHIADLIINGKIHLIINTPMGPAAYADEPVVRQTAQRCKVPCITTLSGAAAAIEAIRALRSGHPEPLCLQDLFPGKTR